MTGRRRGIPDGHGSSTVLEPPDWRGRCTGEGRTE